MTKSTKHKSSLRGRNVTINGRRTSIRLEDQLWQALKGLADVGGMSVSMLVADIARRDRKEGTLTSAVRVYIVERGQARQNGS